MTSPAHISQAERAVIGIFAGHIRRAHSNIMPIAEIMAQSRGMLESDVHEAMRRLSDRGWLVANTTLHWEPDRACLLLGEGLRLAQLMPDDAGAGAGRHGREEGGQRSPADSSPAP